MFTLDEERVELLRQVLWDMCEITTATQTVDVPDSDPDDDADDSHTGIALTITITAKTAEQMRLIYVFTKYQNDALDILLENLGSLNIPMGSLTISQEDAIELLEISRMILIRHERPLWKRRCSSSGACRIFGAENL